MDHGRALSLPSEKMQARVEGPVGWLVFDNPARRNAVSLDMWEAMATALTAFEADPDVRVIVLRGEGGRAFVAGADISQFEQQRSSPESIAAYDAVSERASRALANAVKPTIAMIEGFCIGGGVGIAITCDLRVANEDARFAIPAARLGLGYGPSGVKRLIDLVGPAYTKEIFFTARRFDAAEALAMGLVNRVVPAADLGATVAAMCAMIAANAPLTIAALKRTAGELARGAEGDMAACEALIAGCFASADYVEGRRAFMDKRPPVFKGR